MEELRSIFRKLCNLSSEKTDEGYLIMTDSENKKSLYLVKKGDRYWKTEWYTDFKSPASPAIDINSIFIHK